MPREKMRGLYLQDDGLVLRDDLPLPPPAPGEILVRVLLAGICATDLELERGYMNFRGIPGHEFVGITEEEGARIPKGTRVVGEINCPCRRCRVCRSGKTNHCPERSVLGIQGRDGVFAEWTRLPERNLFPLPDDIDDRRAVFVEPIAACFEILNQIHCRPSDRVAVLGDGRLGLIAAQVLALPAGTAVVIGRHPERRALIESWAIGFSTPERVQPESFDLVVECTGRADGLNRAVRIVRPQGTIVMKSTVTSGEPFNAAQAVVKEVTLVGSRCGPFPPAIQALEKREVHVSALVSDTFALADGLDAFAAAKEPGRLKVQLDLGR